MPSAILIHPYIIIINSHGPKLGGGFASFLESGEVGKGKEKERKSIYIAPFRTKVLTKRSGMDHTVLPANNTMPSHMGAWAEAYVHTKWHLNPSRHLATTDMGRKLGAVCLYGWGAGSSSNTKWPRPTPTCMPSFILIHPTVWPQYTNVTDRQDRQDRQDNGRIA